MATDSCGGWLQMVSGGFGWFWMVSGGFGGFAVLVVTKLASSVIHEAN